MNSFNTRLEVGQVAPAFSMPSLEHGSIEMPPRTLTHLQFRRFAGCPICSLHLRSFARRHDELEAAGVCEVAVFHSTAEALRRYHADLPFAIVPDPEKRLYALYGLEKGLAALLHPRAMWAGMKGMFSAPNNPLDAGGGLIGLPGDFLIDSGGKIVHARYGSHADDHLEVDEVLRFARERSA